MATIHDLPTPTLLLDLDLLERNVEWMAERARGLGVRLRPHAKTHKCPEIAELQRAAGAVGLTVATLEEARVFVDAGFADLTWAFPLILNRLSQARALAERATLRLVVDSAEAVDALEREGFPFHVFLKVDCGYHRAGVDPGSSAGRLLAHRLASSPRLVFDGLLSHSGHAYSAADREARRRVAEEERRVMVELAEGLRSEGVDVPSVSVGSTPAMALADNLEGVTEARPGNYAFYDLMQVGFGSCRPEDCALTVLASVVSSQPGAAHCVLDAGALALSKDRLDDGRPWYGALHGEPGVEAPPKLRGLSQEHGILETPLPVGTRVRVVPVHSCLTAACFDAYQLVRGEEVVGEWRVQRSR